MCLACPSCSLASFFSEKTHSAQYFPIYISFPRKYIKTNKQENKIKCFLLSNLKEKGTRRKNLSTAKLFLYSLVFCWWWHTFLRKCKMYVNVMCPFFSTEYATKVSGRRICKNKKISSPHRTILKAHLKRTSTYLYDSSGVIFYFALFLLKNLQQTYYLFDIIISALEQLFSNEKCQSENVRKITCVHMDCGQVFFLFLCFIIFSVKNKISWAASKPFLLPILNVISL